MKKVFTLLQFVLLLVSSSALADDKSGVYVGGKLNFGVTNIGYETKYISGIFLWNEKRTGPVLSAGGAFQLGYDFNYKYDTPVRLELEVAGFTEHEYEHFTKLSSDIAVNSSYQPIYLNIYYIIPPKNTNFRWYGGAGLGFSNNSYVIKNNTTEVKSEKSTSFVWNISAGGIYAINDTIGLDFGARLAFVGNFEEIDFDSRQNIKSFGIPLMTHIYLGLQATF